MQNICGEFTMEIKFFKCGSAKVVKNGMAVNKQRYKCCSCGYQFTRNTPRGKSISTKLLAHGLYECGMTMRQVARLTGVTPQTISRWIDKWHLTYKTEQGNREILYKVNRENLLECLNLQHDEKCIMISSILPSGTKINIIVQTDSIV